MSVKSRPRPAKSRSGPSLVGRRAATIQEPKTTSLQISAREIREKLGLQRKLFARIVGYSERAVAGWEADRPLRGASLQRMREVARLREALARVMKERHVGHWLMTPNPAFGGLKPVEVIERGEIDRIWRMIYELESGIPA
ncbi:MAG: DUF2384 domain-containing protein [Planctomycetes bacterium]|nr:DUF2384 domain-containing protein [Planctomycetota bacterium]